jgi:antirestriction protein ArdC
MSTEGQNKIYQIVTDQIMDALRNGTVPWRKPWSAAGGMLPISMASNKPYRGVNVWLLAAMGHESPFWGTYKNIEKLGGKVRKGEKSTIVVFWKKIMVDDKNSPSGKKPIFLLRYYRVFNACQADGLPERFYPSESDTDRPVETLGDAESIIKGYLSNGGPELRKVAGDAAYYEGLTDTIVMPKDEQFPTAGQRYAATFHEMAHSTGHSSRLRRPGVTEFDHFGSGKYAREELVAEMTSAMLAGVCDIRTEVDNSAAYIEHWLEALGRDPKLVIQAGAQAQHAADMIRGITHTESESDD